MQIISITAPIFALIAAGYWLRRRNIITASTRTFLSRFVYYAAFPALMFRSMVQFDITKTFNLSLIGANLASTALLFVITFALMPMVRDPKMRGAVHIGSFRSNQGYLGLPVVNGFYGAEALSKAAVVNGFDSITVLLAALSLEVFGARNRHKAFRTIPGILKGLALNPLVLSSVAGITISVLNIQVLKIGMLDQLLSLLGGSSLPLALLSIGCSMEFNSLRKRIRPIAGAAALKLAVLPAITFALSWFVFGLRGVDLCVNVMLTAMPTSVSCYAMACGADSDPDLMASIIGFSTLASVVTISALQWALAAAALY